MRVKYQFGFRWSPDGRFLITMGNDFRGRRGLYRIDAQTGDSTQVVDGTNNPNEPEWGTDGQSIYYRQREPGMLVIVRRDLTSGTEREVLRTPADNSSFRLSPDGGSVAYSARAGKERTVHVIPFAGGGSRTVFRATDPEEAYPASWTPDGRAVLIMKLRDAIPNELWLAPVDGGQPRKIDGDISSWTQDGRVRLSPDGKRVTFVHNAGKPGLEIWALEGFLVHLKTVR